MGDEIVDRPTKKMKLNTVEQHLRKFEYRAALDAAVNGGNLSYALGLLDELSNRNALRQSVMGRPESSCIHLLHWLHRVIALPEAETFRQLLQKLFHHLVEENGCLHSAASPAVLDLLQKIRRTVRAELSLQQKQLVPLLAALDTLLTQ